MSTVSIGQNGVKNVEFLLKRGYELDFFVNFWFLADIIFQLPPYKWDKRGGEDVTMTVIWTGMIAVSVLCGLATGRGAAVASAAVEGTSAAVQLSLSIAGMLCLWTGVMEVMRQSGLADGLSRLLGPVLRRLFPQVAQDRDAMDSISANVSANLLGLGSAATPLGLEAARRLARRSPGTASDSLCMLVVCNTASIQLIPTTVASVRAAEGCASPFDILPAVWLASALSVGVGILACKIFARVWREERPPWAKERR